MSNTTTNAPFDTLPQHLNAQENQPDELASKSTAYQRAMLDNIKTLKQGSCNHAQQIQTLAQRQETFQATFETRNQQIQAQLMQNTLQLSTPLVNISRHYWRPSTAIPHRLPLLLQSLLLLPTTKQALLSHRMLSAIVPPQLPLWILEVHAVSAPTTDKMNTTIDSILMENLPSAPKTPKQGTTLFTQHFGTAHGQFIFCRFRV
ncbi:hypothetical protein ACA910_022615 [Epithemia clementina (nom. ined.)]